MCMQELGAFTTVMLILITCAIAACVWLHRAWPCHIPQPRLQAGTGQLSRQAPDAPKEHQLNAGARLSQGGMVGCPLKILQTSC